MRLPANPPAALFWAVTAYNLTDETMPETEQLLPSTSSYYDVAMNEDGSVDIWFAPVQPEDIADTNFIQTIPGPKFMTILRLYGAEIEFYDETWRPDDLVNFE